MNHSKTYRVAVTEINDNSDDLIKEDTSNMSTMDKEMEEVRKQRNEDRRSFDLTSLTECLNVAIHEYDLERNKKQSFDNRAGIIITVFAAISIAIYDKISISGIILDMNTTLTFLIFIKIVLGIAVYLGLIISLVFAICIISVKNTKNFDVKIINTEMIYSAKIDSVSRMLEIYLKLVNKHRKENEQHAKKLACSQWFMLISIIATMVYLSIK